LVAAATIAAHFSPTPQEWAKQRPAQLPLIYRIIIELKGSLPLPSVTKNRSSRPGCTLVSSEFLCINSKDDTNQAAPPEGSQEIIYQIYNTIVLQDGDKTHVVLDEDGLETLLSLANSRLPGSNESQIQHYEHLLNCIAHAHSILGALPQNFNHPVKFSISALYELVAQTIRSLLSALGVNRVFGRAWAFGYLNQEAKICMMQHGWW
jgi:hypothetical protein